VKSWTATAGGQLRFVTPAERHAGADVAILARRHALYARARDHRPERWSRHTRDWTPVADVVLNPPATHHHHTPDDP
jgi:hypothetical protein